MRFIVELALAALALCAIMLFLRDPRAGADSIAEPSPSATSTTEDSAPGPPVDVHTRAANAPTHAQEAHVGDCYMLGEQDPTWGMANLAFVDCAQPHHGQIVLQHMLTETTAINVDHRPADDPVMPAVDFALEACVMAVWGLEPSELPVGPALYFPTNLVHDGLAEDVMCARESPQLHTGSATASSW
ncbi:hypothetical protein [Cellulosimicrobium cellulans]|uniref:hypothetical protein n=1 Tax=Cellulosimicrobium cellulans TaxID=1710 RepID=UPI00130EABF2|nr:hypothetical protein [Cellulosimicrobium cellulans]